MPEIIEPLSGPSYNPVPPSNINAQNLHQYFCEMIGDWLNSPEIKYEMEAGRLEVRPDLEDTLALAMTDAAMPVLLARLRRENPKYSPSK